MNELFEIKLIILEAKKQFVELAKQKGYVADYAIDIYEDMLDKIEAIINPAPATIDRTGTGFAPFDKGCECGWQSFGVAGSSGNYIYTCDKCGKQYHVKPEHYERANELAKVECQYMITYDKSGESKTMCLLQGRTNVVPCPYQNRVYICEKAE